MCWGGEWGEGSEALKSKVIVVHENPNLVGGGRAASWCVWGGGKGSEALKSKVIVHENPNLVGEGLQVGNF